MTHLVFQNFEIETDLIKIIIMNVSLILLTKKHRMNTKNIGKIVDAKLYHCISMLFKNFTE